MVLYTKREARCHSFVHLTRLVFFTIKLYLRLKWVTSLFTQLKTMNKPSAIKSVTVVKSNGPQPTSKLRLNGTQRLREVFFIVAALCAIFMLIAMFTFDPADPSWSQTAWGTEINNAGGYFGAWLADTLFFTFGSLAYTVPFILILGGWLFCRPRQDEPIDLLIWGTRLLGFLILLLSSCALADIHFDDLWSFSSGGVIGDVLTSFALPALNTLGATLAFLFLWFAGFTLLSGWSWLNIVERMGLGSMGALQKSSNKLRGEETHVLSPNLIQGDDFPSEVLRADLSLTPNQSPSIETPEAPKNELSTDQLNELDKSEAEAIVANPSDAPQQKAAPKKRRFNIHVPKKAKAQQAASLALSPEDENDPLFASIPPSPKLEAEPALTESSNNKVEEKFEDLELQANELSSNASEATPDLEKEPTLDVELLAGVTHQPQVQIDEFESPSFSQDKTIPHSSEQDLSPTHESHAASTNEANPSSQSHVESSSSPDSPLMTTPQAMTMGAASIAAGMAYVHQSNSSAQLATNLDDDLETKVDETLDTNIQEQQTMLDSSTKAHVEPELHSESNESVNTIVEDEEPHFESEPEVEPVGKRLTMAEKIMALEMRKKQEAAAQAKLEEEAKIAAEEERLKQEQAALEAEQEQARLQAEFEQQQAYKAEQEAQRQRQHEQSLNEARLREEQQKKAEFEQQQTHINIQDTQAQVSSNLSDFSRFQTAQAANESDDSFGMDAAIDVEPVESVNPVQPQVSPQPQAQTTAHLNADVNEDAKALHDMVSQAQANQMALQNPFLIQDEPDLPKPTSPMPTVDLLDQPKKHQNQIDEGALEDIARLVEQKLADYKIDAQVVDIFPGPVITRFELDLAPGVKASRISGLSTDLARSLSASSVRVVEVIPGKPYIGLELPNIYRETVYFSEVVGSEVFQEEKSPTAVVLGQDIAGEPVIADLSKMPHVLVAGTTGSGKSVGVNVMILSMLYKATPEDVRFIMIDPKMLELSIYEGIPHLLSEVVTDMKDAANALRWCVGEMERRYKLLSALKVRNIKGFNAKLKEASDAGYPLHDPLWQPGDSMDETPPLLEKLPSIVVIVDEFADLIMVVGKKVEELIARLAQKARAAGIHLVLATQRPSVDVITGLIKANIPSRVAFTVSTKTDSRTILDQGGAESLLGMGDMLYQPSGTNHPMRVHGAFASDDDVNAVVQDWKARGRPQYIKDIVSGEKTAENLLPGEQLENNDEFDELYDQVLEFVTETRRGSISGVQRHFSIGYNRAARIIEQLESQGVVSSPGRNGNRDVLAPPPVKQFD